MSTNKADVVEFCSDVDCGYSYVHMRESRDKVEKYLINHKSASEFVLINIHHHTSTAVIHIARLQPFAPLSYPQYFMYGSDVRPTFHEAIRQLGRSAFM